MNLLLHNLKMYKQNSMFIRIMAFFGLLTVVSTVLVGYVTYLHSTKLLIEEAQKSNSRLLQQAKDAIDNKIRLMENIALQVAVDQRVNKMVFMTDPQAPAEVELARQIIVYLNSFKTVNNFSPEIWLYFDKSRMVLTSEGKFDSQFFLQEVNKYRTPVAWEQLFHRYGTFRPIGPLERWNGSDTTSVVTFTQTIPITEYNPYGMIAFNINRQIFDREMILVSGSNPVFTYIVDATGKVVLSNEHLFQGKVKAQPLRELLFKNRQALEAGEGSFNQKLNGQNYTISFTASAHSEWRYVSITPTRFIAAKANSIGYITLVIVLLSLLAGLVLSYFLARKIYYPIGDILGFIRVLNDQGLIDQGKDSRDELKYINKIISYMYHEKENLKDSFSKSLPLLREKFLSDILERKVRDLDLAEIGPRLEITFRFRMFQVILFEIDPPADRIDFDSTTNLELAKLIAVTSDARLGNQAQAYAIRKSLDKVVLLLNIQAECYETGLFFDFLHQVVADWRSDQRRNLTIAVGDVYHTVADCAASFEEALFALRYKIIKGQNAIIHIDEVRNLPQHPFDYPIETEKQIVNMIKTGDSASLRVVIEGLVDRNLQQHEASPELVDNLCAALLSTIVRTIYDLRFTVEAVFGKNVNLYHQMDQQQTIPDMKNYLVNLFTTTAAFVRVRMVNHNQHLYERVKQYIADNYQQDLSLNAVAELVGLTPSYFSWVFKEVFGVNFIDYINSFRIEKAKEILCRTRLTIGEVARQVGYINSNTFIKVFKKYERITPGQFRESRQSS